MARQTASFTRCSRRISASSVAVLAVFQTLVDASRLNQSTGTRSVNAGEPAATEEWTQS